MAEWIRVHESDLEKVCDALRANKEHHMARDQMNAATHLAAQARLSPLTSTTLAEHDRVVALLNDPSARID